MKCRDNFNLILRSRAQRGVSKDGRQWCCIPPFETGAARPPQGEVMSGYMKGGRFHKNVP